MPQTLRNNAICSQIIILTIEEFAPPLSRLSEL